jgi:hypothetical protein
VCNYCGREKPLDEEGYCSKICKRLYEEENGEK